WLDQSCMLGMSDRSKTVSNLLRTRECVLNLPSADMADVVDRLALTTGLNPVPSYKEKKGYRYEPNKFEIAGLTPVASNVVKAPRALECPVQMEAEIVAIRPFGPEEHHIVSIEARIIQVHVEENLLVENHPNYINPHKWQPLIMNFCEFFGLTEQVHPSRLAPIYRPPVEIGE
ncbi:MAG TPA: flavin reductase family protein, partial [Aggregatilineales bacterium]|nr:flavin reductase family protein [Aggregatilineales bacterium]